MTTRHHFEYATSFHQEPVRTPDYEDFKRDGVVLGGDTENEMTLDQWKEGMAQYISDSNSGRVKIWFVTTEEIEAPKPSKVTQGN